MAIWYILAGIVLFSALTFSFMRSASNSGSASTKGQVRVMANDILRYAKSVEQGVQQLRMVHGCGENDISFYSDYWSTPGDYDNTRTPVSENNFNCHVFNPEGAGINFEAPPRGANEGSEYVITGDLAVQDVGGANSELLLILPNVKETICLEINKQVGIPPVSEDPPADAGDATYSGFYFTGGFTNNEAVNASAFSRERTGCFEGSGNPASGTYHFYHTLFAR